MSSLNSEASTESEDQSSTVLKLFWTEVYYSGTKAPHQLRGPQIQFSTQDAQTRQGAGSVVFFAD